MNKKLERVYRKSCQKQVKQNGSCYGVNCPDCPAVGDVNDCHTNGWRDSNMPFYTTDPKQLASAKKWLEDHPERPETRTEVYNDTEDDIPDGSPVCVTPSGEVYLKEQIQELREQRDAMQDRFIEFKEKKRKEVLMLNNQIGQQRADNDTRETYQRNREEDLLRIKNMVVDLSKALDKKDAELRKARSVGCGPTVYTAQVPAPGWHRNPEGCSFIEYAGDVVREYIAPNVSGVVALLKQTEAVLKGDSDE